MSISCKSDAHTVDEKKVTDYAKRNNLLYGQSDASLTVEAALALPLMILLMMAFLLWIQFFQVQEESMRRLNQQVRSLSQYAYLTETIGADGLLPEQIVVADVQTLRFPAGFVTIKKQFWRQAALRPFLGRRYEKEGEEKEENEEEQVYIAETGSVYHKKADCTHLKLSVSPAEYGALSSMRNENGAIYYACEVCVKKAVYAAGDRVYITKEGNRYHGEIGCRGLLRRVRSVTLEEALQEGRRPCKRCGGG